MNNQVQDNANNQVLNPKVDAKIEAPAVTTFSVENKTLRASLTPKLKGVSFENFINIINRIQDQEVKKDIQGLIELDAIVNVQEYIGMSKDSQYPDNKATGYLDRTTLYRLANPLLLQKGEKLIPYLAGDVKNIYRNFLSNSINNNGKNYAIISKDDYLIYIFNSDHRLISKHNVLLGKDVGDHVPVLQQ